MIPGAGWWTGEGLQNFFDFKSVKGPARIPLCGCLGPCWNQKFRFPFCRDKGTSGVMSFSHPSGRNR